MSTGVFLLLFYYQSQGLGDDPQTEDSLILEFNAIQSIDTVLLLDSIISYTNISQDAMSISGHALQIDTVFDWKRIWSVPGNNIVQEFEKMIININEFQYLYSGFQFRFRNKATLSGNYDHWHIDYVKLDQYVGGEVPPINDVAFVYDNPQLLNRYTVYTV